MNHGRPKAHCGASEQICAVFGLYSTGVSYEFETRAPAADLVQRAKAYAKAVEAGLRRHLGLPLAVLLARTRYWSPRRPAMMGAFPDRDSAMASLPAARLNSYDHADVAPVNFQSMCQTRLWDYPVMFWLDKLHAPGMRVLDAGGHFGTKYIAFRSRLRLDEVFWTVYDLPETVLAARAAQAKGDVPSEVRFVDDLRNAGEVDMLLASGLLQYLDIPFLEFLGRLPTRPAHILLNKVATRDGPSVTTLELIGPARVPYQIRRRGGFEADLAAAGYSIRDSWEIATLGHVIDTHPEKGRSVSRGYLLERTD